MARPALVASAAVLLLALAGCAGPGGTVKTDPGSTQVVVEYDDGTTVKVDVANGTGTILGEVQNDAGDGLPDVYVSVLGSDHVGITNRSGWFQFANMTPGPHKLRADRQGYAASESEVLVKADQVVRVTITLLFLGGEPGKAEHIHDYWADRTEILVMDADYVYHDRQDGNNPVYHTALRYLDTAFATQSQATNCVAGSRGSENLYGRPIQFQDPNQLVWAGTARLDVVFTWNTADYAADETMAIAYKAANDTGVGYWSPPIARGVTHSILVEPAMWDSSHQKFTFWEFNACLWGKGEGGGKTMTGSFHVKMTMVRGLPIYVEPAHPAFWTNGSQIRVVDQWHNNSCEPTAFNQIGCSNHNTVSVFQDRAGSRGDEFHMFRPKGAQLVPPGTGTVTMRLEWSSPTLPAPKPLSVTYSPADVPRTQKADVAKYKIAAATESGTNFRVYKFDLKAGENDAFYQKSSNWAFLWGNEGEERDPGWTKSCICRVHLTVDVTKDPEYGTTKTDET